MTGFSEEYEGRVGTDTSFHRGAKHAELGEKGVVLAKFINIG